MVEWAREVAVFGRISYDLNPMQTQTALEDVRTFERSVGGFAGNIATALVRLGIPTLIVSAVGDDPQGRYIRRWLSGEGVDVSALKVDLTLRTALAFYESWPPDRFPITLFRSPSAPDWEVGLDSIPVERIVGARCLLVSGTALARPKSCATTKSLVERHHAGRDGRLTVFDLDWRPMAWPNPTDFAAHASALATKSDVVVGSDAEFAAAGLAPEALAADGTRLVVVKHGPDGASYIRGAERRHVPGIQIPVVVALGAGDAFVAAFVAGMLEGRSPGEALLRANAAGAIVASRPMCSPAMPHAREIEDVLSREESRSPKRKPPP